MIISYIFHIFYYYHPHISKEICKQKLNLKECSIIPILLILYVSNLCGQSSYTKSEDVRNESELGVELLAFRSSVFMHGTPGTALQGALSSFLSRGFPGTQGSSIHVLCLGPELLPALLIQSLATPPGCIDVYDIFHNGHGWVFSGNPVAMTPCSQWRGPGFQSLVRELDLTCPN